MAEDQQDISPQLCLIVHSLAAVVRRPNRITLNVRGRLRGTDPINEEKYRRVELLQDAVHQQQHFFWNRFTAFATLHAGLFVIATSTGVQTHFLSKTLILVLGIGLSLMWAAIQWRSLQYVDQPKSRYYELAKALDLVAQEDTSDRRSSSTDLAFWSVIPVVLVWLVLLYVALR